MSNVQIIGSFGNKIIIRKNGKLFEISNEGMVEL